MFIKRICLATAIAALPALAAASTSTPDIVTQTTSAGGSVPVQVSQPTLELTPLIRVQSDVFQTFGEVKWFGGNFAPRGYALAHGQTLQIADNPTLFSRLGTTYGGDGRTTFKLPDLRGRAVLGAGQTAQLGRLYGADAVTLTENNLPAHSHQTADSFTTSSFGAGPGAVAPVDVRMPSVALNYRINQIGTFPSRSEVILGDAPLQSTQDASIGDNAQIATVFMDAGLSSSATNNSLPTDGRLLDIGTNAVFFSLIGTTYGGDGRTNFGVPDTQDRLVMGEGNGPGLTDRRLGDVYGADQQTATGTPQHAHTDDAGATSVAGVADAMLNVMEESLTMNYIVSLNGTYPLRGPGGVSSPSIEPFLGEIALFAGNFAPRGWAFADGQLLSISQNTSLFSIFGTNFGGDGRTSFGLPDLRGRVPIGSENLFGDTRAGVQAVSLTGQYLPAHTHDVARPAPVPLPAGLALMVSAFGGLIALRRRRAA